MGCSVPLQGEGEACGRAAGLLELAGISSSRNWRRAELLPWKGRPAGRAPDAALPCRRLPPPAVQQGDMMTSLLLATALVIVAFIRVSSPAVMIFGHGQQPCLWRPLCLARHTSCLSPSPPHTPPRWDTMPHNDVRTVSIVASVLHASTDWHGRRTACTGAAVPPGGARPRQPGAGAGRGAAPGPQLAQQERIHA